MGPLGHCLTLLKARDQLCQEGRSTAQRHCCCRNSRCCPACRDTVILCQLAALCREGARPARLGHSKLLMLADTPPQMQERKKERARSLLLDYDVRGGGGPARARWS
eukprot:2779680-Rhodomonas_salina.1